MKFLLCFFPSLFLAGLAVALPNPAYLFCVNHGGVIETRSDKDGNQFGICLFNQNGEPSECDQWEFFRHQCAPGECLYWSVDSRQCEVRPFN